MGKVDTFALMECNGCGKLDDSFQKEAHEIINSGLGPVVYIEKIKEHFAQIGWKTSWGHDLCPECVEAGRG